MSSSYRLRYCSPQNKKIVDHNCSIKKKTSFFFFVLEKNLHLNLCNDWPLQNSVVFITLICHFYFLDIRASSSEIFGRFFFCWYFAYEYQIPPAVLMTSPVTLRAWTCTPPSNTKPSVCKQRKSLQYFEKHVKSLFMLKHVKKPKKTGNLRSSSISKCKHGVDKSSKYVMALRCQRAS